MYYIDKFKQLDTEGKQKYFIELCKTPSEVQENVLREILSINQNSLFGKKYSFSSIRNYDDFKKEIPISSWSDYRKYSKMMQDGASDVLFSGKTEHFVITSGTTGDNKYIPESHNGAEIKKLVSSLRDRRIISLYKDIALGKFISMSNKADMSKTSAGIVVGTASGITTAGTDKNLLKFLAFPECVKGISNPEACDYAIMRFSIEQDVRYITGNNAARIPLLLETAQKYHKEIIKDIREGTLLKELEVEDDIRKELASHLKPNPKRADELEKCIKDGKIFAPELYWKNFKLIKCWLAGSVGKFTKDLEPYLKNYPKAVEFFDAGYGASEGKFNIPLNPNNPYGATALFSAFYEFLPLESENTDDFLLLHQLEDKKEYKIYITTYSGLYRYDIKDIISVDGFTNDTPNIAFVSKTSDIANIAGEKVGIIFFQKSIEYATEKLNLKYTHFCVVVNEKTLKYNFYIELEKYNKKISVKTIQEKILDYFYQNNLAYKVYVAQKILNPLSVNLMKKGWQKALYKKQEDRGMTRSQIKLPTLYKEIPLPEFILK
jgi:hypothetical protein